MLEFEGRGWGVSQRLSNVQQASPGAIYMYEFTMVQRPGSGPCGLRNHLTSWPSFFRADLHQLTSPRLM